MEIKIMKKYYYSLRVTWFFVAEITCMAQFVLAIKNFDVNYDKSGIDKKNYWTLNAKSFVKILINIM